MCDIGSRRIINGKAYFVTSLQAAKYLRDHPDAIWPDLGGHRAIDMLCPETVGQGKDEEGFPLPPAMAEALNRGELDELYEQAFGVFVRVNVRGRLNGLFRQRFPSVQTCVYSHYKDGQLHGTRHIFKGKAHFIEIYKEGILVGGDWVSKET